MTVSYPGTGTATGADKRPWLRGPWLHAGRLGWAVITVSSLALFLVAIPERYSQLTHLSAGLRTAVAQLGLPVSAYAALSLSADALYVVGSALIAWVILSRKPRVPMALFVSLFLVSLAGATSSTIDALTSHEHAVGTFTTLLGALGYIGLNGLFYLFPDGRFVPRWTWIMIVIVVVAQVPFSMPETSVYNPNSWPAPLKLPVLFGIFGPAVFAQIYRFRRVSDPGQRQQTKWVVYGATAAILLMFVARSGDPNGVPLPHTFSILPAIRDPLLDLGFFLIPLSLGVSVLRYRLWDIDVIINRTLVYGGLTASVVGLYVLIVGYVGTVLRIGNNLAVSLIATGAVAVLFQYLREHLQRGVNRLMYGERDEPYAVLSGLGRRLEAALLPNQALPTIVETIAQALKLPYVAIALRQGDASVVAATYGSPVGNVLMLPLSYGAEAIGALILAPRVGEGAFAPADHRLLDDLARQAGAAVYAVRLTADLQQSRERLVTAREEERRRLRRDLHDGLGPALGAFSLKVGAARNVLPHDRAAADALLAELIGDVERAVAGIRRLVYNLRPPALDDLGLMGAIQSAAAQYQDREDNAGLRVQINAPDHLPPLPAAVEVAAYRIIQEALANIARHARARNCSICLAPADGELEVRIDDDGVGIPAVCRSGVGLQSMRERAEELGGTCAIEPREPRGTSVVAYLRCVTAGPPASSEQ